MRHRSCRFRIYPTVAQQRRLLQWEGALRFLWNLANEQRLMGLARPRDERKFPSGFDQMRELTDLRRELPWLADVPRDACEALLMTLHEAWCRCFKKLTWAPRWKRRGRGAISFTESHARGWRIEGRRLVFPKIGPLRLVAHRELAGRPISCALKRDGDQWFAIIMCELEGQPVARLPGAVGIDRGVAALVADSDGKTIGGPRFAERSARKVARLSRALSRTKKGSSNRAKARLRLARAHRNVRRQRDWLQHQISHDYAKSHGVVVIEKLETARMTRSARGTVDSPGRNVRAKAGLNRSILDAGWSGLAERLRYKLEERGGELVEVPAAYSSQTCSACGVVDAASRPTQAAFCCTACGHAENADTNAARVILGRWSPPIRPVEAAMGQPMKQEAAQCRGLRERGEGPVGAGEKP